MSKLIIVVGAITTASRLSNRLNKAGDLSAYVIHTPSEISTGGCSYSVKADLISQSILPQIKNIKYKKIYIENSTTGGKTYYDIS